MANFLFFKVVVLIYAFIVFFVAGLAPSPMINFLIRLVETATSR